MDGETIVVHLTYVPPNIPIVEPLTDLGPLMKHPGLQRGYAPMPVVFRLEFVDLGYLEKWLRSEYLIKDRGHQLYTPEVGRGYVRDDEEGSGKTVANAVAIYRVPSTEQHYVHRFRFDDPQMLDLWVKQAAEQPKTIGGPGRPPRRWLQLTDYTQRNRRRHGGPYPWV